MNSSVISATWRPRQEDGEPKTNPGKVNKTLSEKTKMAAGVT
jgi:hypothetical protein